LWGAYTARFIDDQGRVIDRSAQDRTTSEGQAYAMFFALVDNDQKHFDKLLAWTEANLASGDLTARLPAWAWGRNSDGQWKTVDSNPASDADLWLAYTLLEAGRLWHDPRYDALGRTIAERIAKEEVVLVPGLGTTLAPGPHGFHPDEQTWVLNPSYLPLPLLTRFAKLMPQGPWASIAQSLPQLLAVPSAKGFAMDWVAAGNAGVRASTAPAIPTAGQQETHPAGSYDAIRVYLWLGISDPGTPGVRDLEAEVAGMAGYLRQAVTPPLEVSAEGTVVNAAAPPGFSAAVAPYLQAVGLKQQAKAQADRLLATLDTASGLYGRTAEYYDQNLALFSTAWSEERFRFDRSGKLRLKWK
jgi:endoglucanase